jgi:HK97 family phage portal protein
MSGYKLSAAAAAAEAQRAAGRTGVQASTVDSAAVIAGGGDIFEWFGGGGRAAGINVTPETAMRSSAVYRCVTLIAGRLMSAPLCVYERTANAPIRLPDHELIPLLQVEPNDYMSGPELIELETIAILLRGNGYGAIRQARNGIYTAIDYFHPQRVMPYWSGRAAWYRFTHLDGSTEDLDASRVLHFKGPGLTWDGLRALSPIQHHAQAVGISLAARDYTARQFEEGLLTNDYFTFEGAPTEQQRNDFKEYLRRRAQGLNGAHNPLLLEKGGKWERLNITAKDAQLLELLQFSTLDIARLFGVPPHLAGEVDKSTSWGTGIEQQNIGLDSYTLLPHRERISGELTRKFFPVTGRYLPKYFIDFDPEAQLRGDMKSRGEFSRVALGGNQLPGFMSRNEVRRSFGLPPIEGGDEVYWPNGQEADPDPGEEPGATEPKETGEDAA